VALGLRIHPKFLTESSLGALALPVVRKKFDELGLEPIGNTPAEFAAVIRK
jgi:hypothetical protein